MKRIFEILRLEFNGRWKALAAALVMGLLALTAPLLPQWRHYGADTVGAVAALTIAVAFALATGLGFGAAILAGPIVQRRESFYLSRPVGLIKLWLGRFLAVLLLSIGSASLALLPALLSYPKESLWVGLFDLESLLMIFSSLICLISLTALFRILIAARSIWALGFPVALVIGFFLWRANISQVLDMGLMHGWLFLGLLLVPVFFAALGGEALASIRGRSDPGRAARIGGVVGTSILLGVEILMWAGLSFLGAATPADTVEVNYAVPAPEGPWMLESVQVRRLGVGYQRHFLRDSENGKWLKVQPLSGYFDLGSFSADGRRVAVLDADGARNDILQVKILDLDHPEGKEGCLAIFPVEAGARVVLSPTGTKAISAEGPRIRIWDVETGKLLANEISDRNPFYLRVMDSGKAWIFLGSEKRSGGGFSVEARRFEAGEKQSAPVWRQDGIVSRGSWALTTMLNQSPGTFLVRDPENENVRLVVRNWESGAILWEVPLGRESLPHVFRALNETAVIASEWSVGGKQPVRVVRFGPGGVEWSREFSQAKSALFGPMIDGNHIAVILIAYPEQSEKRTLVLNVGTGESQQIGETDLIPAVWPFSVQMPKPGSLGSRLFIRARRELLRLDEDGKLEPLKFGK